MNAADDAVGFQIIGLIDQSLFDSLITSCIPSTPLPGWRMKVIASLLIPGVSVQPVGLFSDQFDKLIMLGHAPRIFKGRRTI